MSSLFLADYIDAALAREFILTMAVYMAGKLILRVLVGTAVD